MPEAPRARLTAVAVHLPSRYRTMEEIRAGIAAAGSPCVPPPGLLEDITGVRGVHVREEGVCSCDLAVAAARKALAEAGTSAGEIDLLLFAAASQDMIRRGCRCSSAGACAIRCSPRGSSPSGPAAIRTRPSTASPGPATS
ncbi:hypothetical protein [Streptomyces sp. enrichment culture]|uniref:hypothetical protein n=1 Tax=Streptomyces sp. enrichment culture TaxID=1795815 RepID=UPI003F55EA6D